MSSERTEAAVTGTSGAAGAPSSEPTAAKPSYTEWLRPAWWALLFPPAVALVIGLAYLYALGPVAGSLSALAAFAGAFYVLSRSVTKVSVADDALRVGRARLPWQYVGTVRALDAEATTAALGPRGHADAYLVVRSSYSDESVAVAVDDERDPHPYWLVSTKHPERLVAAMMAARQAKRSGLTND